MSAYWVYILANKPRSTLYIGVTSDLIRRVHQHRENLVKGFTQRYGLKMLVYFEKFDTPHAAIQREKNIKHWSRMWKLQLIEAANPKWRTSTKTSRADGHHGLPGHRRAKARRSSNGYARQ